MQQPAVQLRDWSKSIGGGLEQREGGHQFLNPW